MTDRLRRTAWLSSRTVVALAAFAAAGFAPLSAAQAQDAAPPTEWTPLTGDFSDIGDPWIPVPNGSSGAPRQGWLATADGFFTREAHLAYSYLDGDGFDAHEVLARFHHPLSRRLWVGVELPFYRSVSVDGFGSRSGVGDATITTQVMLAETRNLSLNAGVGFQVPIGDNDIGGGVFAAQPQLNLWTDLGSGFSFRGRVAYAFPDSGVSESFRLNAAIGQTVTPHDAAPFGDLTWYVSGNLSEPSNGPTFLSITPGMRTHVGGNLFLLAGIEIPVVNRSQSYNERFIVQLVQGF